MKKVLKWIGMAALIGFVGSAVVAGVIDFAYGYDEPEDLALKESESLQVKEKPEKKQKEVKTETVSTKEPKKEESKEDKPKKDPVKEEPKKEKPKKEKPKKDKKEKSKKEKVEKPKKEKKPKKNTKKKPEKEDSKKKEPSWEDMKDDIIGKSDKDFKEADKRKPFKVRDSDKDKMTTITKSVDIEDYLKSYADLYVENETHYIVNFALNTTTVVRVQDDLIYAEVHEYENKEEHYIDNIGTGMLLKSYRIFPDGDIEELEEI